VNDGLARMDAVRIVLVGTTHPGNIGATARAMKNMGLSRLCLVAPKEFPSEVATARASGAAELLDGARRYPDLGEALAGCRLVVATTARERYIEWPFLPPREAADRLLAEAASGPVALVFGREKHGLSNAELEHCQYVSAIPTSPEYSSLNLAAAVQVFAYEMRRQALAGNVDAVASAAANDPRWATAEQLQGLFEHLEQTLREIDFLRPDRSGQVMRKLVRLFSRARLAEEEIHILRGILTAVRKRPPRGKVD
jgi:TrmH family RNA methyltransferase